VGDAAAEDRSDNAEHDRPEDRHVHDYNSYRKNTYKAGPKS
jgi:hypothetical protein